MPHPTSWSLSASVDRILRVGDSEEFEEQPCPPDEYPGSASFETCIRKSVALRAGDPLSSSSLLVLLTKLHAGNPGEV